MNKNAGFTLIELLVVVLIIGILSALALPQYQVAVGRTKYQQLVIAAGAFSKAQELYYLANGSLPTSFDEMDISMGKPDREYLVPVEGYGNQLVSQWSWGSCSLVLYGNFERVQCQSTHSHVPQHTVYRFLGKKYCHSSTTDKIQQQICRTETGLSTPAVYEGYLEYEYP